MQPTMQPTAQPTAQPSPAGLHHITADGSGRGDGGEGGSARSGERIPRRSSATSLSREGEREQAYAAALAEDRDAEERSVRGGSYYQGEPSARGGNHYYQPDSPSAGTSVKPGSCAEPAPPPHMNISIEEPGPEYFDWGVWLSSYPKKFKGGLDTSLPFPPLSEVFWSWLGAFLGILAVSALNQWVTPEIDIALMVGSFGASAVLVFGMLESKMAQPRNFVGGQLISSIIGITTRVVIHETWIGAPVGMSLALVAMQLTRTTHPPGGATALIAATLPELPKWHGYSYIVTIGLGTVVMQIIALLVNNLAPRRRYPTFWL